MPRDPGNTTLFSIKFFFTNTGRGVFRAYTDTCTRTYSARTYIVENVIINDLEFRKILVRVSARARDRLSNFRHKTLLCLRDAYAKECVFRVTTTYYCCALRVLVLRLWVMTSKRGGGDGWMKRRRATAAIYLQRRPQNVCDVVTVRLKNSTKKKKK